ncbi:hypothetical protein N7462_008437 [Penicillium macrosclerotiorum]|uniref:uncharacterized protein n=1 Tax=Penicillium macrosclerotiorum TaxID=303699 RepID=UPI00254940BE|nr:uncharacterized protein N7462_008437 [Penicillium macrosclerotiorum]KAJ5675540.1 hypothetical protein N7462_008437 [Penicillium macrosclerotiorum]
MSSGKVLYSANVGQIAHEFPLKGQKSTSAGRDNAIPEKSISTSVRENSDIQSSREDPGAVVFLFPPKGHCGWTISSLWLACKLWLLELISPANDEGCKSARVDKLVEENHKCKKALQAKYSASKLWYLEVIAVHPALQSRGLGAGVMRSVLDLVADQPIYLECTRYENIGFYENFGFRVIEKVELTDAPTHEGEVPNLNYWVMVRSAEVS